LKTKNWQAALADIREIHFGEPDDEDNETAELLGEAFTEWRISNTDYESPEQILDEAYYSVNCDYYLAAYLQYPLFRSKPDNDFLRPYFDLWQQGYGFALGEDCLYLYR
jgi:apolipoprotein C-I